MSEFDSVVVTGMAPVCCMGIGTDAFWTRLLEGQSGIHYFPEGEASDSSPCRDSQGAERIPAAPIAGKISDFSAKEYVQPRKNIKIMSRDVQLGLAAGALAIKQAAGEDRAPLSEQLSPERVGIDLGTAFIPSTVEDMADTCIKGMAGGTDAQSKAERLKKQWGDSFMDNMFPLWMLKYLPNMSACHIGIANDLQGPSNTQVLGDVGALVAAMEGIRCIQRDAADAMVVGGVGNFIDSFNWSRYNWLEKTANLSDPEGACRPFDALRDGLAAAEGAGCMVLEAEQSAKKRGAKILAKVRAWASCSEGTHKGYKITGKAIRNCLNLVLQNAGIKPEELSHINANGWGTKEEDAIEAQAIAAILPGVPVVALKGVCGYAGSGSAAVEMIATIKSLETGILPAARNYSSPDSQCPINIVYGQPETSSKRFALTLTFDKNGSAAAMIFESAR